MSLKDRIRKMLQKKEPVFNGGVSDINGIKIKLSAIELDKSDLEHSYYKQTCHLTNPAGNRINAEIRTCRFSTEDGNGSYMEFFILNPNQQEREKTDISRSDYQVNGEKMESYSSLYAKMKDKFAQSAAPEGKIVSLIAQAGYEQHLAHENEVNNFKNNQNANKKQNEAALKAAKQKYMEDFLSEVR